MFASQPSTAVQLSLDTRTTPDTVTLVLHGEVDMATVGHLKSELHAAERRPVRRIVLDLSGLAFIDSSGVHALLEAQRRADARGYQLVMVGVPEQARRLFHLTGLMDRLTIGPV